MPTSGSGTVTPVTAPAPGPGLGLGAYPIPYTLLSLPRLAQMLGIAPVHFMGAVVSSISPAVFPVGGACGEVWPRHDWQKYDQTSLESLARAIKDAEAELAKLVNYWPAPTWISEEDVPYPRDFRPIARYQTYDVRGYPKAVRLRYKKVVSGGRRAVSLVNTASVATGSLTYSDEDGDGFSERATIVLATTLSNVQEIKVYFTGMSGHPDWEIRPMRSKTISGGVLTIVADSWLFINPETAGSFPTDDGFSAIDISTTANFVTAVDVYREYNDVSQASAELRWEQAVPGFTCAECGGAGCAACAYTTQEGCFTLRDAPNGLVAPLPAVYGTSWTVTDYTVQRAPDRVAIWYYSGNIGEDYASGVGYDPLSDFWAWTIAYLAIARLERPPCGCANLASFFDYLRTDLAQSSGSVSYNSTTQLLNNPLGTHAGEVLAWNRIKGSIEHKLGAAAI